MIPIGRRSAAETPQALLLECHQRIRHFIGLAVRLGQSPVDAESVAAAALVHRYFAEALPLHVADEEALASRLTHPAAARMSAEHLEHQPLLQQMLALLQSWATAPQPAALTQVAQRLAQDFERHLLAEEREVFPLLSTFSEAEQVELVHQMRRRRQSP